jgi:hypothetical protein
MGGTSIQALFTLMANNVDLPHHALTDPGGIIRFYHFADELMTKNAGVWVIAFN